MSMNAEQENFEELRRLLALKRHEQPPPGFFNDFSRQVVAQIQAGEGRHEDSAAERLFSEAPWLLRLWRALETKPMLAGAFGVVVCSLLVTCVVYSEKPDANRPEMAIATSEAQPNQEVAQADQTSPDSLLRPAEADLPSTAGAANLGTPGSIFEQIGQPSVEPASFAVPSGN